MPNFKTKRRMKTILTNILILISIVSFGQEITTIRVSVPNKTDEVYIVGNQDDLGNWQPDKVKLSKISEYEREISLNLTFPAEFKLTRGNWNSEAVINKISGQPNFILNTKPINVEYYKIQGWTDQINKFSTYSEFQIVEINSKALNQKRKLYVSLPENYNDKIKYPVIYVTDAHNLNHFEIVSQTIRQQSNFSNFPECIVVGIYIIGKERDKELDITYSKDGVIFKDFIFNEVISFVDKNYSTSSFKAIFGHSNGAEYNHYLMFEKNNPFDAFMNISENLSDLYNGGNVELIKNKFIQFITHNKKPIKYFVASAKYDHDDIRYPSGLEIEKIIQNNKNNTIDFKHNVYKSWHNDLVGYSVLDALQFIFSNYQDYGLFETCFTDNKFNYASIKQKFIEQNEKYIQPYIENENSSALIFRIIDASKKINVLNQMLEFEDPEFEIFDYYARANMFAGFNDYNTSAKYWEKVIDENNEQNIRAIIFTYAKYLFETYENINKKEQAFRNIEILLQKNPKYELEFKYLLAKIGIENNLQIEKSKKYLKQVERAFKENKLFEKGDLEKLRKKQKLGITAVLQKRGFLASMTVKC
jgi:predicted alpha/beta superfamily hydrolase